MKAALGVPKINLIHSPFIRLRLQKIISNFIKILAESVGFLFKNSNLLQMRIGVILFRDIYVYSCWS